MGDPPVKERLPRIRNYIRRCEAFIAFNKLLFEHGYDSVKDKHAYALSAFHEALTMQFVISLSAIWDKQSYPFSLRGTLAFVKDNEGQSEKLEAIEQRINKILSSGVINGLTAIRSEGFAHPLFKSTQREKAGDDFGVPNFAKLSTLLSDTRCIVIDLHTILGYPVEDQSCGEALLFDEFTNFFKELDENSVAGEP